MKRITVKDIANHLNIAQSTVSKALADKPGISSQMKEKVWAAAEELGYSVNRLAQGLAKNPIDIGIIMPSVWPEYYGLIEAGLREGLSDYYDFRFNVTYRHLSGLNNEKELEQYIDELIDIKVNVVILCPAFITHCGRYLNKLKKNGIKLVLLGTDIQKCDRIACIRVNAKKAGTLSGEFADLIMHESKKIAVFIGNRGMQEHDEKQRGFAESLKGTDCTIVGVYETQDVPEIASIITKKVLDEQPDLEAIYVGTSNSIAVCQTLDNIDRNNKIKIIATDIFKGIEPYLQSRRIVGVIYQDPKRMSRYAMRCVYEHFYEGKCANDNILISPLLVMRANLDDNV